MVVQYSELRPTSGWDLLASLRHPCKFQCVSRIGSVTARQSSSGHQPNFAALNIGRHLYSARRPSRWAFADIVVVLEIRMLLPSPRLWTLSSHDRCCQSSSIVASCWKHWTLYFIYSTWPSLSQMDDSYDNFVDCFDSWNTGITHKIFKLYEALRRFSVIFEFPVWLWCCQWKLTMDTNVRGRGFQALKKLSTWIWCNTIKQTSVLLFFSF